MNESISTYLLPPALGEVRRRWPQMRFAVTVGMSAGRVAVISMRPELPRMRLMAMRFAGDAILTDVATICRLLRKSAPDGQPEPSTNPGAQASSGPR